MLRVPHISPLPVSCSVLCSRLWRTKDDKTKPEDSPHWLSTVSRFLSPSTAITFGSPCFRPVAGRVEGRVSSGCQSYSPARAGRALSNKCCKHVVLWTDDLAHVLGILQKRFRWKGTVAKPTPAPRCVKEKRTQMRTSVRHAPLRHRKASSMFQLAI